MKDLHAKVVPACRVVFTCLIIWSLALHKAAAATNTVTSAADTGPGTLRAVLAGSANGDIIVFDPGLNGQEILLTNGELTVTNSLTIAGPGAGNLGISGENLSRVFSISGPVTTLISGLTLSNGNSVGTINSSEGGAVYVDTNSTLTILACMIVSNSTGDNGGGIYNLGTLSANNCVFTNNAAPSDMGGAIAGFWALAVSNCTFLGNSAEDSGAIFSDSTQAVVVASVFSGDYSAQFGGGIHNDYQMIISGCTFTNETTDTAFSGEGGGAVYNNGTLALTSSTLSDNTAINSASGAAIYNDSSGFATISNTTIFANTGPVDSDAGGIYNAGVLQIVNSTISSNTVFGVDDFSYGGGINNVMGGMLMVGGGSVFVGNSADYGGGIYSEGTLTVNDSVLSANIASNGNGGGIDSYGSALTVSNCTISSNVAALFGGGIRTTSSSTALISDSALVGNNSLSGNGGGLDVDVSAVALVVLCTFSGNNAPNGSGGGIFTDNSGTLTLSQCNVVSNSATTGGGIGFADQSVGLVSACAFTGNSAPFGSGGGLDNDSGFVTVALSTFFGNSATSGSIGGILNTDSGLLVLSQCTVAGNTLDSVANFGGSALFIDNTILSGTISGGNITNDGSPVISEGYNLSDDASGIGLLSNSTDLNNFTAGFDPNGLQNNGGPTLTVALLPGSPAVGAGRPVLYLPYNPEVGFAPPSYPSFTDQRGFPRFTCGQMDVGAFQSQFPPEPPATVTIVGPYEVVQHCGTVFNDPGAIAVNLCADALSVVSGANHSLALLSDGTVIGWGDNSFGQLNIPHGLSNVVAIAAGNGFSLALTGVGTVVGWGRDDAGQIDIPSGLTNLVAIAAGGYHALALQDDGSLVAWGTNTFGQTTIPGSIGTVVAIAAGMYHSLALQADGTVIAWGAGSSLTDAVDGVNFGQSVVPTNLENVAAIAAGGFHNLALTADGTLVAWGDNANGQTNVPAALSNQVVMAIGAGEFHSLAITTNGNVTAWGNDGNGQTNVPPGLTNAVALAAGNGDSLALTRYGTVVGWGLNTNGQASAPPAVSADLPASDISVSTNGEINSLGAAVLTYTAEGATATRIVVTIDTAPPTISCPADITATNDSHLVGSRVSYTAPVGSSPCSEAQIIQTGGLASGLIFPIGVTTNTFLVRDGGGLTNACSFTVTVPGPQSNLQSVADALIILRRSVPTKPFGRILDTAITNVTKAAAAGLWQNDVYPTAKGGLSVFTLTRTAVGQLVNLLNSRDTGISSAALVGAANDLAAAARLTAVLEIEAATNAGGSAKLLDEANADLASGDTLAGTVKVSSAMQDYQNAWSKASSALPAK